MRKNNSPCIHILTFFWYTCDMSCTQQQDTQVSMFSHTLPAFNDPYPPFLKEELWSWLKSNSWRRKSPKLKVKFISGTAGVNGVLYTRIYVFENDLIFFYNDVTRNRGLSFLGWFLENIFMVDVCCRPKNQSNTHTLLPQDENPSRTLMEYC